MGHLLHGDWLCLEACRASPAAYALGPIKGRARRALLLEHLSPQGHSGTNTVTGAILACAALSAASLVLCTALPRYYISQYRNWQWSRASQGFKGIQLGGVYHNIGLGRQNAIQQHIPIIHCNGHKGHN